MRVWRFQQISDEENKTIDGTDQSFNALQEENNDKDNSQTESETKKEQMSSQCLESEQEEMQQMEEAQNQQQESENNGDISNDSNKEGSSSNNNNDDNLNVNEEEQNINGLSKQENSSNGNLNSNQDNNSSNNSREKSDTGNKQEQESSEQQNSQNNSSDSLGQQNQNTQSQNNQNQSEQEPFQLSLDADEFSQEFKQQLSENMCSFSGLQGMSKQESQQSMSQQGSQQSGSQQSISQQESQETGTQQSDLEQDMNQSNGQQDRPQQNTNQSGIQQGSSQQSTWSNQSGEKQENLSHGNETRKENSEVPSQNREETLEDDINQSTGKKAKPKRSNTNQNQSSNTESSELKEPDSGEQNASHNKPSNSTDGAPDVEPVKDEQSKESKSSKNITEQERQDIRDIFNNCSNLSLEERRRLLNKVKKRIKAEKKYRTKLTPGNKKYIKSLEEERINENNSNNITDALGELPSFEERQRGDGYAIDTTKLEKVPNSVIKTLIDKFLNQRFCKKETNLNVRSNSLEETNGFHKWKVKDVIAHLKTHQVTKVLTDKVGYTYADGKNENVPLSFYFDMSGSMEAFTSLLATIAIELLKKHVKVLIGYNERVNVQVEKIDKDISIDELVEFLTQAGDYDYNCICSLKKQKKVTYIPINRNIDNYLVEKKAERCVVFSDFDPISEVVNLSSKADVCWFCFEDSFDRYDLKYFQGFIYKVKNIKDIAQGLIKVNSKRFESLCFTDNPAALRGKVRKRQ